LAFLNYAFRDIEKMVTLHRHAVKFHLVHITLGQLPNQLHVILLLRLVEIIILPSKFLNLD
jgi:hypothetical protein